jgi:hypothetical protein
MNCHAMTKILCRCLFDITATGVTGHYKSSRIPFCDHAGQQILDESAWHRSRNQQRNWETLTQIISLRTQVQDLSSPVRFDGAWEFEFATETPDAFGPQDDPTMILQMDSSGVPMIQNLPTGESISQELVVSGPDQNIWFLPVAINNS